MAEDTRTATSAGANAAQGALTRRGVFWRFAARSLRLNRSRTIVSIIGIALSCALITAGIALSCALITAIFTSMATLYEGLLKAEIVTEGAWQVELVNVPEDEIDVVHADSRVARSYDRISYGDAIMPKSFEGYWGRYLSVQEWPTADKVKGLKPLPHIAEGRAPQAPDEIVLTHNVDAESGEEAPCLDDESLYTAESATGDVISEYLANPGEVKSYKVVGFYAPEGVRKDDVWGRMGPGHLGFVSSPEVPVRTTSIYLTTNLKSRTEIDGLIEDYTGNPHAVFNASRGIGDAISASRNGPRPTR